ncbi:PepSY domain-containing protein [Hyphobacterium sp. CCMP332]|uniref:PepSY domain-containing protein n=1 Tax=Hyphobacterium sp. CCMP332 TaxID=2749086 RepID=UPI00164F5D8C|nr:PepSY domain-containing protein [Hyphobacterium sp. CCMP332]QNL19715.1 PepSY domain-containing protein [Hyphobacterium sp. CCMP332]
MRPLIRWLITLHKWAALIIGLQVLAWVAGGLVMSAIPIQQVRGEHNIAGQTAELDLAGVMSPGEAAAIAGITPTGVELRPWLGRTVYEFGRDQGASLIMDAVTGDILSPIDADTARAVALADYAGEPAIDAVTFFPEATWESRRAMPTWRVDFADGEGTRLYVSAATGEVIARRNDTWRFYDFFWMLHIMDYGDRSHFNHPLLILASLFALGMSLFGFILLFPWLGRMLSRRKA